MISVEETIAGVIAATRLSPAAVTGAGSRADDLTANPRARAAR